MVSWRAGRRRSKEVPGLREETRWTQLMTAEIFMGYGMGTHIQVFALPEEFLLS